MFDLPGHYGLSDAGLLEQVQPGSQLTQRNAVDGGHRRTLGSRLEIRKRFFLERDDGDVVAGAARGVEDQKREPAVAGDQSEGRSHSAIPLRRPHQPDMSTMPDPIERSTDENGPSRTAALLVGHFLGATGGAPQNHAAL